MKKAYKANLNKNLKETSCIENSFVFLCIFVHVHASNPFHVL